MTKQLIDIGTTPNDGTGSNLRTGGDIINDNFNEIYTALGDGSTLSFDITGVTNGQSLIYNSGSAKFEVGSIVTLTGSEILTNKTLTSAVLNTGVSGTAILDEDTLSSNSDTKLATQQSIKAYVDNQITGLPSTLTIRDDSSTTDTVTIGTDTLSFAGGTGITSVVGSNEVTFNIDSTVATLTGSQELTNKTINGSSNTLSNIANSSLTNSFITINGTSITLGNSGTISAGTDWQTGVVADGSTITVASAGEGYFIDTTSFAHTLQLPASPTIGDEISIIDVAGTFDTNNLTVDRNGKPIQGSAADLTVSIERAGFTLVFYDNTQGWVLKDK